MTFFFADTISLTLIRDMLKKGKILRRKGQKSRTKMKKGEQQQEEEEEEEEEEEGLCLFFSHFFDRNFFFGERKPTEASTMRGLED